MYPVFKNFYAGGIGSVRGYLSSSLGAVEPSTNDALGGASRLIGNAELQMPFPGSGNDRSLRWFGFLDGGQVYQEGEKMRDLATALFGRPGHQLDFAGRSAQAELC